MTLTAPSTPVQAQPDHSLGVLFVAAGGVLLAISICAGLAFLVGPLMPGRALVGSSTAIASITAILVLYGLLALVVGRALLGAGSRPRFRLPAPLLLLALFFLVVGIGGAVLNFNLATTYLFPLWHIAASLLVPLTVLSLAARRLGPVSARSVFAQFTWGGLVSVLIALVLELMSGAFVILFAAILIALVLGSDRLNELLRLAQRFPVDPQLLLSRITSEPLVIVILAVTLVFLFVFLFPLFEEVLKAAGPALLLRRRTARAQPPRRGEVLLWGLTAGAGFAFTETLLNSQTSLSGGGAAGAWATAMILRGGTALVHMLASATVTLGWYEAFHGRRPRLVLLLIAATTVHGLWNVGALLLGGAVAIGTPGEGLFSPRLFLLALVLLLLLAILVGCLVWLRWLLRWAEAEPPFPQSSEPPGTPGLYSPPAGPGWVSPPA